MTVQAKRIVSKATHQKLAKGLFNYVWTLLLKKHRKQEEDELMVDAAHASMYHWRACGGGNPAVGEWQISHVYAVLGRVEPAMHHGKLALKECRDRKFGDFTLAYAYEALARASALARKYHDRDRYLKLARRAGKRIKDNADRKLFFSDLASIPGA
jgi:hypothetical protein